MILGDTAVVIQDVLGITPEALDAVDVVAGPAADEGVLMTDDVVLAEAPEGLVTAEGVSVVHRALAGTGLDMAHQFLGTEVFDDLGIDASIPFQQAKNDTFASRTPTAFAFAASAEVGLIQFDLALEFAALELGDMEYGFAQSLIHARDHLGIDAQILGQAVGRLQLIKTFQDFNLTREPGETFTLATMPAFDVTARGSQDTKRTAENALATPQKFGRTGKMTGFPCNHKHLSYACGYETP